MWGGCSGAGADRSGSDNADSVTFETPLISPIVLDEKLGRRVAANSGVAVIGSAGVLLAAKRHGLVEAVRPIIDAFTANGYGLSRELVHAVLVRAGEA